MRNRTATLVRVLVVVGLLLLLPLTTACTGSAKAPEPTTPTTPDAPVSSDATIKLLEPVSGAEVQSGSLTVRVETTGLEFTMPSNTNVDGQGHVHFTLDDRPFVMSVEPEAVIEDVAPGVHRLKAELVQNNTEPFDPPIEAEIEFTAK